MDSAGTGQRHKLLACTSGHHIPQCCYSARDIENMQAMPSVMMQTFKMAKNKQSNTVFLASPIG
jgi:hypothetical protein